MYFHYKTSTLSDEKMRATVIRNRNRPTTDLVVLINNTYQIARVITA